MAVDDDQIFRFLITELLIKCGIHDPLSFENGEKALHYFQKKSNPLPDILLLDLNMPIMDGWNFLEQLKDIEDFQKIEIWVLSSSDYPEDLNRAKAYSSVSNVLTKPLSLKTLREALNKYIQKKSGSHDPLAN